RPSRLAGVERGGGRLGRQVEDAMRARGAALAEERGRLVAALQALPVDVCPSGATFVLFRPRERDGRAVWEALLAAGVLVRDCSSWPRLASCLRVTIGTEREDDAFLAALEDALR